MLVIFLKEFSNSKILLIFEFDTIVKEPDKDLIQSIIDGYFISFYLICNFEDYNGKNKTSISENSYLQLIPRHQ